MYNVVVRSFLVVLVVFSSALPAHAQAGPTEGATGLSSPRGDGTPPPVTNTAPSTPDVPPAAGSEDSTTPDGAVPPPPSAYPQVRYAAPDAVVQDDGARIPPRLRARLRVLDQDLQALSQRGGNRILDGVFSLLTGGLAVGIGIWKWDERETATYLLLYGGANVLTGLVSLFVTPNPSSVAIEYNHMPMTDLEAVRARVAFGERSLRHLARRTKVARFIESGVNVLLGVMVIPLYLAPNDFEIDSPFDYLILVGSGISLITGIIGLATRSPAEKRWERYRQLRDRLAAEEEGADEDERAELADRAQAALEVPTGVRFQGVGAAPMRGGAAVTLGATF